MILLKVGKAHCGEAEWNNKYDLPDFLCVLKFIYLFLMG